MFVSAVSGKNADHAFPCSGGDACLPLLCANEGVLHGLLCIPPLAVPESHGQLQSAAAENGKYEKQGCYHLVQQWNPFLNLFGFFLS